MPYDLVIKDGTVVDGTGAPRRHADVAIENGRITEMGTVPSPAKRTIDASDLVVTPGFIDVHTHYDAALFWDPLFTPSSWHGITTVVITNCGVGFAPCREGDEAYLIGLLATVEDLPIAAIEKGVPWKWHDFRSWMETLDRQPKGINVGCYAGLSPIRRFVMGDDCRRAATSEEIVQIQAIASQALGAGALGLSTSRFFGHYDAEGQPNPSAWAEDDELQALALVLRAAGRGVFELIPSTGKPGEDFALEKEGEFGVADFARKSGRPVTWGALRYSPSAPDRWLEVLEEVDRMVNTGVQLYPQIGFRAHEFRLSWSRRMAVFSVLDTWREVQQTIPSLPEKARALADPAIRDKLRAELRDHRNFNGWRYVWVQEAARSENRHLEGRSVAEIADKAGEDPLDAFLDIAVSEGCETEFLYQSADMEDYPLGKMIQSANVLFETDSSAHLTTLSNQDVSTYLLSHWVRDNHRISLEQAVNMITGRPAKVFGLHDRGQLKPGARADVVVLDPDRVRSGKREFLHDLPGGGRRLVRRAVGIHNVIVNGQELLVDAEHQGIMPGELLRPADYNVTT